MKNNTITTRNNITIEQYEEVCKTNWSDRNSEQKEIYNAWSASVSLERDLDTFQEIQAKIKKATAGKLVLVRKQSEYDETYESFGKAMLQLESVGITLATWTSYSMKENTETFLLGCAFGK